MQARHAVHSQSIGLVLGGPLVLTRAGDDVEIMDDGAAAQVEQVLAGAEVAGAASLPVADVGEHMLDGHALAQLGAAGRRLLLSAQLPEEPLVGVDDDA